MKKVLFILLLTFIGNSIYAQNLREWWLPTCDQIEYNDGNSYGYEVEYPPADAVSYEWSITNDAYHDAVIWPSWLDSAVDITYSKPGTYLLTVKVTLSDGSIWTDELEIEVLEANNNH